MTWRAVLRLAVRSLARRPGRTLLTIIAVVLGSGLLVTLATVSQIADSRVVSELGKGGPAAAVEIDAATADPNALDTDSPKPGKAKVLDDATVSSLRATAAVTSVTPVLAFPARVLPLSVPDASGNIPRPGATSAFRLPRGFDETVVGLDMNLVSTAPIALIAGRLPTAASLNEVAVTQGYLDQTGVAQSHPEYILGGEVEFAVAAPPPQGQSAPGPLRIVRAAVVGVVSQQVTTGEFVSPIQFTESMRQWVADTDFEGTATELTQSQYSGLIVVARNLDSVHAVRVAASGLGYSSRAPEHLVASVEKYLGVVDIVLGAIGLTALVIATLGITNAMLASVRERRRQIGVLKAIGARDGDVVRWFIVEAFLIGSAGGILGTALGVGGAFVVGIRVNDYLVTHGLTGIDLGGVPGFVVAAGIVGSIILAVIAAGIPAFIAARLPARESLNGGA